VRYMINCKKYHSTLYGTKLH